MSAIGRTLMRCGRMGYLATAVATVMLVAWCVAPQVASASSVQSLNTSASSWSQGATAVRYGFSFIPATALQAGSATVTMQIPGVLFPPSSGSYTVANVTSGRSGSATAAVGALDSATMTMPVGAAPGQRVVIFVSGGVNPALPGPRTASITTSGDQSVASQAISFSAPSSAAKLTVSASSTSPTATFVTLRTSFVTTNALPVEGSRIAITLPNGMGWDPRSCSYTVTDVTTGVSLTECPSPDAFPGATLDLPLPFPVGANERVEVTARRVSNPLVPGVGAVGVSTTADPALVMSSLRFEAISSVSSVHAFTSSTATGDTADRLVSFISTHAMTGGDSVIILSRIPGLSLPVAGACSYSVRDRTTGKSGCGAAIQLGSSVIITTPVSVNAGDRVHLQIFGVTNITAGVQAITLHTSSDPGDVTLTETTSVQPLTWLHTDNGVIRNTQGQQILLTGFNQGGMYQGQGSSPDACGQHWTAPPTGLGPAVARLGFNSVRLLISWANLEPTPPTVNSDGSITHHWDMQYVATLDSTIASLSRAHVYLIPVMVDGGLSPAFQNYAPGHCEGIGFPAWEFPNAGQIGYRQGFCDFYSNAREPGAPVSLMDGFVAAWRFLAARFASDKTVAAFDMIDEPAHDMPCVASNHLPSDYLDAMDRTVAAAIRQVDPAAMLILEGQNHSNGTAAGITTAGLTNVIYTWHCYPRNWTAGVNALNSAISIAHSLRVPLYIGEFDLYGSPAVSMPANPTWLDDTGSMTGYMRQNSVSWAYEVFQPGWADAALSPDAVSSQLFAGLQHGLLNTPG